jgi:putative transposase
LELSKIGLVKIFKHRELQGQIKTVTIRRSPTGKWFACFSCKIESPKPLPSIEKIAGIDMGLTSFATLSTGEKIENPRFFRKAERDIAKAQRKLSKCSKGTPARKRAKYALGHIYEKISNRRQNFAHKTANKLIKEFQIIILEKLNIIKMTENGFKGINKSIQDASWKQFIDILSFKAECAGRKVIFVDPRNTSKMCSRCGQIVEKNLSERVHSCTCGCVMDRDHNASLNILRLGTQSLAIS